MIAFDAKLARSFRDSRAVTIRIKNLQACRMPDFEPARRSRGRLPARRPPIRMAMPGSRIKAQPGDHSKGMSIACINGDPLPATATSKAAQIAGAHRRTHQSRGPQDVRNCPGTIITGIQKRFMSSAISIRAGTKLVGCPDRSFHHQWSFSWSPSQSIAEASEGSRNFRPRRGKRIRSSRWNESTQNRSAKKSLKHHLSHRVLVLAFAMPEPPSRSFRPVGHSVC